MIDSALEDSFNVSVILMGSFQFEKLANDIDLILLYKGVDYVALKNLKATITKALNDEFGLPVHYTTLSQNEYAEMEQLHIEKQQLIFDANKM